MVIMDYKDPSVEGSTIKFSCPPGFALTGPSTAVCTQNGDWEPDPREAMCKGNSLYSVVENFEVLNFHG